MKKHSIDATYTVDSLLEEFFGKNSRNMLIGLQKKHNFEMSKDEQEFITHELNTVTKKLSEKCQGCPDATKQLEWIKERLRCDAWLTWS